VRNQRCPRSWRQRCSSHQVPARHGKLIPRGGHFLSSSHVIETEFPSNGRGAILPTLGDPASLCILFGRGNQLEGRHSADLQGMVATHLRVPNRIRSVERDGRKVCGPGERSHRDRFWRWWQRRGSGSTCWAEARPIEAAGEVLAVVGAHRPPLGSRLAPVNLFSRGHGNSAECAHSK